ncbi:MAG TPA: hypothetical protein IGR64_15930 [Leptolyngbyaceae cyanobacterium M65_K2018_010]|nr:hypothetical protein [Leptolyngbyaceae cyanobacterium M65_K2018_010]
MATRLKHIFGTLSLLAMAAVAAPAGFAQQTSSTPPETIPEAFDRLVSTYSGTYFENRSLGRQLGNIFGFGFPERELDWDGHATAVTYRDMMQLQNTAGPTLRVPDLATPYSTSLLTMPSSRAPYVGTEFIFESF